MLFFSSPLEQFEIVPFFLPFGSSFIFDISFNNATLILALLFSFIYLLYSYTSVEYTDSNLELRKKTFFLIPQNYQTIFESVFKLILSMISDNISSREGVKFFPIVFAIFSYVLFLNLIGLIPYSFTLTSHIVVTFALALFIFIAINIICIKLHGLEFFSLFLPGGTSFVLALLLVPIEVISFVFKPISLSIRLFANMMAGHTLLKVIAGFAWTLSGCSGVLFLMHYVPLLILFPLFGLELGVAFIQAFVFSILTCIYLNDAIDLH